MPDARRQAKIHETNSGREGEPHGPGHGNRTNHVSLFFSTKISLARCEIPFHLADEETAARGREAIFPEPGSL
jgi:hypothetical protein